VHCFARAYMIIEKVIAGPCATNAYVVISSDTQQAAVIDVPPDSAETILSILNRYKVLLTHILLTHSHWDHIGDVAKLQAKTKAAVFVHPLDADNVRHPGSDGLPLWNPIQGVTSLEFLNNVVSVGSLCFTVIEVPGHTPGGVGFFLEKQGVLFSGDTLFKGTMGRVDLPTSSPEKMWSSLAKFGALPKETKVFPGHGEETTIGQELWIQNARKRFKTG